MTALWVAVVVLAGLAGAALAAVMLRRPRAAAARPDYDLAVYRDQLDEVERDLERGLLGAEQAAAARIEIQRRILAAAAAREAGRTSGRSGAAARRGSVDGRRGRAGRRREAPSAPSRRPWAAGAMAVAVPAAAVAVYLQIGSPGMPDQPLASRAEALAHDARNAAEMERMIQGLAKRLQQEPDNLEGWILLARSERSRGRLVAAREAFQRAVDVSGRSADILAAYGEMMVEAEEGMVTPAAQKVFEESRRKDPLDPRARFYLALALEQAGDKPGALQGLVDLRAVSPAGAPWLDEVDARIRRAAEELGRAPDLLAPTAEALALAAERPRPSAAAEAPAAPEPGLQDVEALSAMGPAERQDVIRGMVDRLAQRLNEKPDDADGWLRLARAYDVLGEADKAAEARRRAAEARIGAPSSTPGGGQGLK